MTSRTSAIIAGAVALWVMSPVVVQAFEQQMPPAPAAPVAKPDNPALSLDDKVKQTEPENKGRSFKLPGIGKLSIPKLDFGLDLMYGTPETSDTDLGFSAEPADKDDVTIMGKVKRRF